jgi:hypothetical protein
MVFETVYGEPIVRILNTYPPGSDGLIKALENLCKTAEENAYRTLNRVQVEQVCEGLHPGTPGVGLKCLSCYMAEQNYEMEKTIRAEVEAEHGNPNKT